MEQVSTFPDLHDKITEWKSQVSCVRADLNALSRDLEKAVTRSRDRNDLARIEHFQNQFICQREVADKLFHDLKQVSRRLRQDTDGNDPYSDMLLADSDYLGDRMKTFNSLFTALKSGFEQFIGKLS
jgi:hypothetical protein